MLKLRHTALFFRNKDPYFWLKLNSLDSKARVGRMEFRGSERNTHNAQAGCCHTVLPGTLTDQ